MMDFDPDSRCSLKAWTPLPRVAHFSLMAVLAFECELMTVAARHGFHGIHFADDWGTQTGLMISPDLWRRLFDAEARRLYEFLGAPSGGFIGYVEEYGITGMSVENYNASAQAFSRLSYAPQNDFPGSLHH